MSTPEPSPHSASADTPGTPVRTGRTATAPAPVGSGILGAIERWGNRLPTPFVLFLVLFGLTGVISTAMAAAHVVVQVPGATEPTIIKGLFTAEGMTWLTTNLGTNYVGFPPLVNVMPILLAIGVAERSGLLSAAMRLLFGAAPRWLLPYVVGLVGVTASMMADSSWVVIPPLAALVFRAAGRHPVAGLLGGFAATGAGFATNLIPTANDAMFAGITTSVLGALPQMQVQAVTPVSNWWFNIAASLVLAAIAGALIDRVLEPRLVRQGVPRDEARPDDARPDDAAAADDAPAPTSGISPRESRALLVALIAGVLLVGVVLALLLPASSPWRNDAGAFLPKSPLIGSIVFLVVAVFATLGLAYGIAVGTIRSGADAVEMMGAALREMIPFLVLAFILGQFIALFSWSGIGSWLAVNGAELLQRIGLTGIPAVLAFIVLASLLNLFITSGSAMWSLMAVVFVPMFALLGYEPGFTQAAFRIGDSATQVITPMNPYMIVVLGMLQKYEPHAGFGTLIARLLPFTVLFWIGWVLVLLVFMLLGAPLGPGNGIRLG